MRLAPQPRSLSAVLIALPLFLCGCTQEWPTYHSVRQRFVPTAGPSSGGASWSPLAAARNQPAVCWAQARAGLGDSFPVQDEAGKTAFEVVVAGGDDAQLLLEIRSSEGSQRIGLGRDKPEPVNLGGRCYELLYPTVTVSTADITTTSKALILITRR
jgi:hypothetical protein